MQPSLRYWSAMFRCKKGTDSVRPHLNFSAQIPRCRMKSKIKLHTCLVHLVPPPTRPTDWLNSVNIARSQSVLSSIYEKYISLYTKCFHTRIVVRQVLWINKQVAGKCEIPLKGRLRYCVWNVDLFKSACSLLWISYAVQSKNDIRDVGSTADFADVSDICCFSLILDTPGTCKV